MTWLSHLNPTPAFPAYTGPHQVGTVDVEVPAADLSSPSFLPENAPPTVAFRLFYPCEAPLSHSRPVRWIPSPQHQHISAFAKFLGAGSRLAQAIAIFPRLIYYISIPAHRNAPLKNASTREKRWPVMFFSHGLAGSRNLYSHICGSIASHGVVVIAMDHRDGSSPMQFIRATKTTKEQTVEPINIPHTPSPEVYEARDKQLRIRMWEIALAHIAMLRVDQGATLENLDLNTSSSKKVREDVLTMFANTLDIHTPGKIIWSGHSFGAQTMHQLLKSVYYEPQRPANATKPLFTPNKDSDISKQITDASPLALLDLWGLPQHSPDQEWLWKLPLPCYSSNNPGGRAVVSVLSEGFFKWTGNLNDVKRAISPPTNYTGPEPSNFYPTRSQHFSQSDFGILFPTLTSYMKAEEPERVLKLNMRAMLETFRRCGIEVSDTSKADMEISDDSAATKGTDDTAILAKSSDIRGWTPIPVERRMSRDRVSTKEDEKNMPAEFAAAEEPQAMT